MGVYHRRPDVAMSEEFLDGADVIPRFEAMGRKGMPQRMATRTARHFGNAAQGQESTQAVLATVGWFL
jgi:hypothetical protein